MRLSCFETHPLSRFVSSANEFLGLAILTNDVEALLRCTEAATAEVEPLGTCRLVCRSATYARLDVEDVEEVFPHISGLVGIHAAVGNNEFALVGVDIAEYTPVATGGRNGSQANDLF